MVGESALAVTWREPMDGADRIARFTAPEQQFAAIYWV